MATKTKDFSRAGAGLFARAAVDLAFSPDLRLTLDADNKIIQCDVSTEAGHQWIAKQGVPLGMDYDKAHAEMNGLIVEAVCL